MERLLRVNICKPVHTWLKCDEMVVTSVHSVFNTSTIWRHHIGHTVPEKKKGGQLERDEFKKITEGRLCEVTALNIAQNKSKEPKQCHNSPAGCTIICILHHRHFNILIFFFFK